MRGNVRSFSLGFSRAADVTMVTRSGGHADPTPTRRSTTVIAMPANHDSSDPAVSRFLDVVCMERGLSPNTLAAYRADLRALARWLAERDVPIMNTTSADLQEFIASRV